MTDPLESLRPGSPNARREGNAYVGREIKTVKWAAGEFEAAGDGALPIGEAGDTWAVPATSTRDSSTHRSSSTRPS